MVNEQVLTVREAAETLGVSVQRVRQMIKDGQLVARRSSGGWLLPESTVLGRFGNVPRGRPAEPRTVWAAISLLAAASGHVFQVEEQKRPAEVVADRRLRHRVLRVLAALPDPVRDPAPWVRLLSSRGRLRRLWAHPGVLDRLVADPRVSPGGDLALATGVAGLVGGGSRLPLYVGAADVEDLIRRYRLRDDSDGGIVLVVVPASVPAELAPAGGQPVPAPAAVADLLDEDDARARNAGLRRLGELQHAVHERCWHGGAGAALTSTGAGRGDRTGKASAQKRRTGKAKPSRAAAMDSR